MRRLILLGLMAAIVLPVSAAKRSTVVQLEHSLAADLSKHRSDEDVAHQLGDLELSERLTDATLDRFAATLPLGPRTALSLQLLADQSAFFDPPTSELPATQAPDAAAQQHMLDLARGYVVRIQPHLPDFFATRTTARFDDKPQIVRQGEWPVRTGMHLVGTSSRDLTYRDGHEVIDPTSAGSTASQPEKGMTSHGEFGPELNIVLTDTAKGSLTWSHWEKTSGGLAAVYKYSVPRAVSHFEVSYCCLREDAPGQRRQLRYGNMSQGEQTAVAAAPANARLFQDTPGYHGTLSVDPDSGAILRVTLESELKNDDPIMKASTIVQYGPVMIGDERFIFPVRSMALSMEEPEPAVDGHPRNPPVLLINETMFRHYRRLGASIRMLTDKADAVQPSVPSNEPNVIANTSTQAAAESTANSNAAPPNPDAPESAIALPTASGAAVPTDQPADSVAGGQPLVPDSDSATAEMSLTAATGVPEAPANQAQPNSTDFQLKMTSRLVDVGIVATDKKGRPVKDLKAEDFEILDNGRKQDVRFFTEFNSAPATSQTSTPSQSFSNRASDAAATAATDSNATILLLDEAHIAWTDMQNARGQILKFVQEASPSERIGVYSMTATGFRVIEEIDTDHAKLIARLQAWKPTAQSATLAQEEETRNRQSFNEVHSAADLNSVNGNQMDVPDAQQTVDPMLRTMGSNPGRASLIILRMVARHLSAVSGHKSLVWVSSDNVFADWQSNQVGIDKSPKQVDTFAMHAQEAMNDAHVAVYPMDVSQLETSAISADIRTRNVELTQSAADNAASAGGAGTTTLAPGRNTAEMQQDMHPIQGPIRMVAESTGGRVIRRAGDLAAALNGVVEDGHATYLVSFSPPAPADDQYHNLSIKVIGGHKGLTLRYRTGYLYAKEPTSLKDRFQQAVWAPMDMSEIAITASRGAELADGQPSAPQPSSLPIQGIPAPGAPLKINIAATDLGLKQLGKSWTDRLDIFFIQRDDAGIKALVDGQTMRMHLKPSTYQNLLTAGVPYEQNVQMKPGMGSLRVLVVDENSGRMGSVTLPGTALASGK